MAQSQIVRGVKTSIRAEDGTTYINYRGTDVVAFDADTITLNSGGWHTATTKLRMNQASNQFGLGYQVYQKDFDWYVKLPGQTWDDKHEDFADGWIITRRHCA